MASLTSSDTTFGFFGLGKTDGNTIIKQPNIYDQSSSTYEEHVIKGNPSNPVHLEPHTDNDLDINIEEDESDFDDECMTGELVPISITLGTDSTTFRWCYPSDHMLWVKRVWMALDPELPNIVKDAAALILLADTKRNFVCSPVFKCVNQQAKIKMQSMKPHPIPRLYLAILQAMALCDEKAQAKIYNLIPSLKPQGEHRNERRFYAWQWGSSRFAVEVFPTHLPEDHSEYSTSLSLTDDFYWPVDWGMDWDSESSKGERLYFDEVSQHWEAHLMENDRQSNPEWYSQCVGLENGICQEGPTEVCGRAVEPLQLAAKYQALTEQLKLMIKDGSINGSTVGNLLKQIKNDGF
ncbi:hypothetical protein F5Y11DRAFT_364979 [Daldinia sp. FL1419]|nr:hypothetical protein F5Y11DRAFT_364979 [Daldinia sp. FL1419]